MTQNGMMYKLFANCIRVKGYRRAVIYDLQRNLYHLIPHSLYDLFDDRDILEWNTEDCTPEEMEILEEYLNFLTEHTLIFPVDSDEAELFPKLNRAWDYPSIITNAIIDLKEWNRDWTDISRQLDAIKCYHVQIRCYMPVSMEQLELIASSFRSTLMQAFEILLPFNNYNPEALIEFADQNPKLRHLCLFKAPEATEIRPPKNGFGSISNITENITSAAHCGIIHPSFFSVNTETYTESLAHNSCLNRKISIDADGNIKNCPSMKESFGNITGNTLQEAIHKPGFNKYWNITKNEITKCKDCEFRYMCTDCRAFVDTPDDPYAAPLKCGYDPHTCVWEEWSDNPLKQQVAVHYMGC